MIRRIRYTKPTAGTSIAGCIIGAAVNGIYIFREITASGIYITAVVSLVLGILGGWLDLRQKKICGICLLAASVLPVWLKFSGLSVSQL